jgi:hypothetical protein
MAARECPGVRLSPKVLEHLDQPGDYFPRD